MYFFEPPSESPCMTHKQQKFKGSQEERNSAQKNKHGLVKIKRIP